MKKITLIVRGICFLLLLVSFKISGYNQRQNMDSSKSIVLTEKVAANFAKLALKCVQKEYHNKLDHVMNDAKEIQAPSVLHPAFYGCFDWHSSVH